MGKGVGTAVGGLAGGPVGAIVGGGIGSTSDAANSMKEAAARQQQYNRPNQYSPFGSSSWSQGPDGSWTQNTNASQQMQPGLFNLQNQWNEGAKTPLDNGAGARQHAEDALYSRETSRLDPQWQQAGDSMKTELLNQGFTPGTEAYNNAYGNFSRAKNDAYSSARNDSITMGGQEATRQQQMDMLSKMYPGMQMQQLQQLMQQPYTQPGTEQMQGQQAANQYMGDMYGGIFNLGGKLGAAAVKGGG